MSYIVLYDDMIYIEVESYVPNQTMIVVKPSYIEIIKT
jgi:hypothetical protein